MIPALESLKYLHFNGLLLTEVYNVRAKKVQRASFMTLENDAKFEEKVTCGLAKWHEEFGKYSPEHRKVSKLGLLWCTFIKSRNIISLKFTGSYVFWKWKIMQNLKRNWLVISKLTWGIQQILTQAFENLNNLHFNRLILTKVYIMFALLRKYRGVTFDDTQDW